MRNGRNLRGLLNRHRKRATIPQTWAAAKGVLRNKAHASPYCSSTSNPNNLRFWGNMLEICNFASHFRVSRRLKRYVPKRLGGGRLAEIRYRCIVLCRDAHASYVAQIGINSANEPPRMLRGGTADTPPA